MGFVQRLWFRLRAFLAGRRVSNDIDREMAFHVAMETEQNLRAGMSPDEASRLAHVAFGGRQRFREEARDEIRSRATEDLMQDVRHALRTFRRTPAFTATVIATLALGIGATTVIFSVADHVVLRSLPYAHADRLVGIQVSSDRLKNVTPTWVPNAAHFIAWRLAAKPAQRFGLWPRKGTLAAGADADLALFDPDAEWTADPADSFSAGLSPYAGRAFRGRVVRTLVGGRTVYALGGTRERGSAEDGRRTSERSDYRDEGAFADQARGRFIARRNEGP